MELGRMGFVVEMFGFFAPGNKRLKRSLIVALRDLELAQLEEFVIRLMELLPDGRFVIDKPGVNLREMEAQRPRCSRILLLERQGRSRGRPGRG